MENVTTETLKKIADEIANSRVRLAHPLLGNQTRQDIIDEAKRLEGIEITLRRVISKFEDQIKNLLGDD